MNSPIAIEFEFQRSGYTDAEIAEYTQLFSDMGAITTRTYEQPAAGPAFGLYVVIKFLAETIAGGIAYDVLKELSTRLTKLFTGKKRHSKHGPEIEAICFSFNDKDVTLGIDDRGRYSPDEFSVSPDVLERLTEVYDVALPLLNATPLKDYTFQAIRIPVKASQEPPEAQLIKQFWKINPGKGYTYDSFGYGTYYDMTVRQIIQIQRLEV